MTYRLIRYGVVGRREFDCLRSGQGIGVFGGLGARRCCRCRGDPLEEEGERHVQHLAQMIKPAGADAVGPAFVFLHLLERDTLASRKFLLGYS